MTMEKLNNLVQKNRQLDQRNKRGTDKDRDNCGQRG